MKTILTKTIIAVFICLLFIHLLFSLLLILFPFANKALAAAHTAPTNINKVSDLFEMQIDNKADLDKFLEHSKTGATSGISSKEGLKLLPTSENEAEEVAVDLNAINANNLEDAGHRERTKEENQYLENMQIDYGSHLIINHKKDIDLIANASEKLMLQLLNGLKQLGVDCKKVKGNKEIEPTYNIEIQKKHLEDTIYNQTFCEELRNKYNCTDKLVLRCLNFSEKPVKFEITNSTIPYEVRPNNGFTSYYFSSTGQGVSGKFAHGGILRKSFGNRALASVGFGIHKSSSNYINASELEFSFSFNVSLPVPILNRLEMTNISYGAFMQVSINNVTVYVGPTGGDRLALNGHHAETTKGKKKYGGKCGKRVTHTTYYPRVNTGSGGDHILGMGRVAEQSGLGLFDLRRFARQGLNTVKIKVIAIGTPFVSFTLNASERICNNWHEDWVETCVLQ